MHCHDTGQLAMPAEYEWRIPSCQQAMAWSSRVNADHARQYPWRLYVVQFGLQK